MSRCPRKNGFLLGEILSHPEPMATLTGEHEDHARPDINPLAFAASHKLFRKGSGEFLQR